MNTRLKVPAAWFRSLWTDLACLITLSLLCIASAYASNPVELVKGTEVYPLGLHLSYFEDIDGHQSLDDVRAGDSCHTFIHSDAAVPNFSFTASTYWFQFELTNQSSTVDHWLLESQYPLLDRINVYLVYPDNRVVSYRGGDKLPFAQRAIKHRNVMFNVPLAIGETVQVYIKVRTESSMQLPLVLRSPDSLQVKDHDEQYILAIYYGILLAMLLYNLLIFISMRDVSYLYYVSYLIAWILFQMSVTGFAFEYLWPDNPSWGNKSTPFFLGIAEVTAILFARSLLQTKTHMPKMDRVLKYWCVFCAAVLPLALFASYTIAIKLGTAGALIAVVLIVSAGTWSLKMGLRQARYFMLAWSALFLGITLYVLKTVGVIPSTVVTEYFVQIGAAFEVIMLSFALADRMRQLKDDNARIQRETTETLELRVQQRTQELDQALLGLSEVNSKLMELNHVDGLTGINNRGYFNEQFNIEWQRAARIRSPLGLLILDIDHFKRFNDSYGHLGGDACLKQVASLIASTLRRPADKCYRYGGEEFVTVLPHTDQAGSVFIAERIREAVEAMEFVIEGQRIPVTISIGVCSVVPHHDVACETLIGNADQALYQAKHGGRNRVAGFAPPPTPSQ